MPAIGDILEGSLSNTGRGIETTRTFHVTGLGPFTGHRKKFEALLTPGIPPIYTPHPSIPGCIVTSQTVNTVEGSPDQARVVCNYGPPDFQDQDPSESPANAQISVGATTQSTTTEVDVDGNSLETTIDITTADDDGNETVETITDINQVDILVPNTVIEFDRREPSSPILKARDYVSKVNSVSIGIFDAETLLCLGIEGRSDDGGQSYDVMYRFQYKPNGWRAEVAYIDPETDRIHPQVKRDPPNGFARYKVYESADFSNLNLPW